MRNDRTVTTHIPPRTAFAAWLRRRAGEAGYPDAWSLAKTLARAAKLDWLTARKRATAWWVGDATPDLDALPQLAAVLGVDLPTLCEAAQRPTDPKVRAVWARNRDATLTEKVRAWVRREGLTVGDAAKLAGIPRWNFSRIHAGGRVADRAVVARLADAMNASTRELARAARTDLDATAPTELEAWATRYELPHAAAVRRMVAARTGDARPTQRRDVTALRTVASDAGVRADKLRQACEGADRLSEVELLRLARATSRDPLAGLVSAGVDADEAADLAATARAAAEITSVDADGGELLAAARRRAHDPGRVKEAPSLQRVGMRQRTVADRVGVGRTTVVKWEKGAYTPSPRQALRAARAVDADAPRVLAAYGYTC